MQTLPLHAHVEKGVNITVHIDSRHCKLVFLHTELLNINIMNISFVLFAFEHFLFYQGEYLFLIFCVSRTMLTEDTEFVNVYG